MALAAKLWLLTFSLGPPQEWVDIWTANGHGPCRGYDVVVSSSGNPFAAGLSVTDSSPHQPALGVVKFTPAGQHAWVRNVRPSGGWITDGVAKVRVANSGLVVAVTTGAAVNGNSTFWLLACSSSGDSLWMVSHENEQWGGSEPFDVTLDNKGFIYVTGPAGTDTTGFDILTAKYSEGGQLVWLRTFDGSRHASDYGYATTVDDSGYVYVAGQLRNSLNRSKPVILKYSPSGDLAATIIYGQDTENNGGFCDLIRSADGFLYAAGAAESSDSVAVVKYRLNGDTVWTRVVCGGINKIALDRAGNLCATGWAAGDMSTWKFSPAGSLLWQRTYDRAGWTGDDAFDIAFDPGDSVVVAGFTTDEAQDPDITAIKYSPSGSPLWVAVESFGDTASQGTAVATDAGGNVYVVGRFLYPDAWVTIKYPPSGPGLAERAATEVAVRHGLVCTPSVVNTQCLLSLSVTDRVAWFTVCDIAGRAVRELTAQNASGRSIARWDVKDARGLMVGDGVYFATVHTPAGQATVKLVIRH